MQKFYTSEIKKSDRIDKIKNHYFANMPQVEHDRAVLLTDSYMQTEGEPIILRRAKAFKHICENLPVTIRPFELIVGTNTKMPRSCQLFPEYSFEWVEKEFETMETRSADPFHIDNESKKVLHEVYKYWKGKTTSDLASSYMTEETHNAIDHNIFTPGNYFYNGVGHITVKYWEVLEIGYSGIKQKAIEELAKHTPSEPDYQTRSAFLNAVIISCDAAMIFAARYAELALNMANVETDPTRKNELLLIAYNCANVPINGAKSFYEACQSFWFVQLLIQTEGSGHSISPGRFDQYMYPYLKADLDAGKITREFAQELVDCIWLKLNELNKIRDAASAEGFAGYSLFQNLCVGGQTTDGRDATNDMSFMCIEASKHVMLPQPSLSVRVWNKTPNELMLKAVELTRTGIGLPAYYNDEVIIPALLSRGYTFEDARNYNIIGCVEPQCPGKTDGWHDAAFFNMCRPIEMVFSNGMDCGVQIGPRTGDVSSFDTFDKFFEAYKTQMEYFIALMVNADNAIDHAHRERCPLPFESCMVDDCIKNGKAVEQGGAIYNFTGPQGFGISNMADGLYAIKTLVYDEKRVTIEEYKQAILDNFGKERTDNAALLCLKETLVNISSVSQEQATNIFKDAQRNDISADKKARYQVLLEMIDALPKFGNDDDEIDQFAREVAYSYTKPLETYLNPRGGMYHAGLYPVSANVPLGAQTGATPDGRLSATPVADGVSPVSGKDTKGPTAAANSVAKLDHYIASNGTLYNMKFHPTALAGKAGLQNFADFIRGYFDQKGMHMQFNVVSKETLIDAQKHPENYRGLVVRVAGYSALFTTLSRSLQDDIINRTEMAFVR